MAAKAPIISIYDLNFGNVCFINHFPHKLFYLIRNTANVSETKVILRIKMTADLRQLKTLSETGKCNKQVLFLSYIQHRKLKSKLLITNT